jgi:Flp pilus assembly protein TadD
MLITRSPFRTLNSFSALKTLCLLLYLVSAPKVTQAQVTSLRPFERVRALVVGVSDYANDKIADLPFADDDAEYFAQMLREQTEWPVAPGDIVLLTDQDATYGRFIAELSKLTESVSPRDRVIIFFAGHGDVEVVSDIQTGYLLFHDAPARAYAAGGACEVYTLDQAIDKLILGKRAQVILIADACRSGSLAGSRRGAAATASVIKTLFGNTAKILSCEPDELSLEAPDLGGGHGLFSYYLVQGMMGAANRNDDAYVSLLELERYLQDQVMAASGERQTPSVSGPTSLQIAKARRDNPTLSGTFNTLAVSNQASVLGSDPTKKFLAFSAAVSAQHLVYPAKGSAYNIYQTMGDGPDDLAFKQVMKTTLIGKLQADAQRAVSEYLNSPGKELARRWVDSEVYAQYPEYLEIAAGLLGEDDYFYPEVMARAHYFRGVNLRLKAELTDADSSLFHRALAEQEKALKLQAKGAAPHIFNEIGLVHRHFNRLDLELEAFQNAHEQSPRWGLALTNLAFANKRNERLPEAERLYLKAIQESPELSLPYYNLAVLYEEDEQVEKAIEFYELAGQKPDPLPEVLYNLAILYRQDIASLPAAERAIQQYLRLVPDDTYGYLLAGALYLDQEKSTPAWEMFEFAESLAPDDFHVLNNVAFLAERERDFNRGIAARRKMVRLYPEDHSAHLGLAESLLESGQPEKAMDELRILFNKGFRNYDELNPTETFGALIENAEFRALLKLYFPDKE